MTEIPTPVINSNYIHDKPYITCKFVFNYNSCASYEKRGLKKETALTITKQLSENDALGAHMKDELSLNERSTGKQFNWFSTGASFTVEELSHLL